MTHLVLPCAGRSSRFPNMPPKWMLTHPKGQMMLLAGLRHFQLGSFAAIVVTVTRDQVANYDAEVKIRQAFRGVSNLKVCVLEEETNGPLDTVIRTAVREDIKGPIVVKDSDNCVGVNQNDLLSGENFVAGSNLRDFPVRQPHNKSYLSVSEQGYISDIVEKEITSDLMCAGVYGFALAEELITLGAKTLARASESGQEVFLSHLVASFIFETKASFRLSRVHHFEDWGTAEEWRELQLRSHALFVDFDGVMIENSGQLGTVNWDSSSPELVDNLRRISELADSGAQIIVTTSRPREYEDQIRLLLKKYGIEPHAFVFSLHHSPRVLINDFASTNQFPSASAISIPRNGPLRQYV